MMSIRLKLLLLLFAFIVIPLAISETVAFMNARAALKKTRIAQLESIADLKVTRINEFFNERKADISEVARFIPVIDYLSQVSGQGPIPDKNQLIGIRQEMDKRLISFQKAYGYDEVLLASRDGKVVYCSNPAHSHQRLGKPLPDPDPAAFNKAKTGFYMGGVHRSDLSPGHSYMLIAAPVRSDSGKFLGVIALGVSLDSLDQMIQDNTGLGRTGETVMVINVGDGALFLSPARHDPDAAFKRKIKFGDKMGVPAQNAAQKLSGSGTSIDYQGHKVIAAWRYLPDLKWGVVAKIETREAFAAIYSLSRIALLLSVIILLLAAAAAIRVSNSLAKPIRSLHKGAEIIGQGNLDHKVGTTARDEIGQLSRAFDQMTANLKKVTTTRDELEREIEERKHAEKELKNKDERLRFALDSMQVGEWGLNLVDHTAYRSLQHDLIFGYKELLPEWTYEMFLEHVLPEDREQVDGKFRKAMEDQSDWDFECRIVRTDKQVRWIWAHGRHAEAEGKPTLMVGLVVDISARKQAELARLESEAKYRRFVENSLEGVISVSLDGRVNYVNSRMAGMLGYKQEEMEGSDVSKFVPQHLRATLKRNLEKRSHGIKETVEFEYLKRDGSIINVLVSTNPYQDNHGKYVGTVGFVTDITAQKKAESLLRESEQKYRQLIETSLEGVWAADANNTTTFVNGKMGKMLGYNVEEMIGKPIQAFVPESRLKEMNANLRERGKGISSIHEFEFQRKDRSIIQVQISSNPLIDEKGGYLGAVAFMTDITERKRAEEELHQARQLLNDLLEMMPVYVVLLTPDYHVRFANKFFRGRFGEDQGRRCYEYLFDRDQPCEICETFTVLRTKKPHHWEWTGPDARNYDINDFPFTDADGTNLIMEVGIDVTERKQAEEKVRAMGNYNRSLIEASPDPLVTISEDGKITDVNIATEAFTGCSRGELIGTDFSDYFTEPEKARAGYKQVLKNGYVKDYALNLKRRDGRIHNVLYNAVVYRDEQGKTAGVFAAARDITEHKKAEEKVRAMAAYNRNLIEASLDPLVTISENGKITDVNAATEKAIGLSREKLIGTDFSDYFTEPDRARAGYQQVLKDGYVKDYELEVRHQSGRTTPILYNASVYWDESGEVAGVFAAARDITAIKQAEGAKNKAEQELAQQRIQAIHADRLRSLGEMAASIAHELNQPLVGMRGMAEHIALAFTRDWNMPKSEILDKANLIIKQADRMSHVIEHTRTFGRQTDRSELLPVDVNDVVNSSLTFVHPLLRPTGLVLETHLADRLPKVMVNPFSLEEIVLNLVSNARDAMLDQKAARGSPGKITMKTYLDSGDSARKVVIEVTDTGPGIPEEILAKIFEPFFSTKSMEKGTGLGLAISKSLVEGFGGKIEVRSKPGNGTTAMIILPAI